MKKYLLALPLIIIFCFCLSAHSTIREGGHHFYNAFEDSIFSDTLKAMRSSDTATMTLEEAWKEWKTVQNFEFGKNRGSLPMIADLHSLHPYFRDKITQLIKNCKAKGIQLVVVESFRTHAKQYEYFSMGKKYTRSAGGKSKHQYGLAVDVVPVKDTMAVWDNATLWKKIGAEGEKLGLRWGGRWKSPYDPAHFEWSGGLTTYQLAAGALPVIPKSTEELYPCIEDDIQYLKKHWELWENEQELLSTTDLKQTTASSQKP